MMASSSSTAHHPWAVAFGVLGNVVSFMVYLAPLPTFYRVYKKKSTEGFQSIPYVVALFSAMLWIYYAILKTDAYPLITINTLGCVIETIYITMYITYAPKKARILTAKLLLLLNLGMFCLILLLTLFLSKGDDRVRILGWICVAFSACVFAAPLSIMRLVIRTRSVEFMPFSLSLSLTFSAVLWFSYGLLLKDMYIALPNVLGFIFGVLQMALYVFYKYKKEVVVIEEDNKSVEVVVVAQVSGDAAAAAMPAVRLRTMGSSEVHPIELQAIQLDAAAAAAAADDDDEEEKEEETRSGNCKMDEQETVQDHDQETLQEIQLN